MKRSLIVLTVILAVTVVLASTASAAPSEDLWEKLFGCNGIFPISCPGPLPW